jgi:hypothetical protein
MCHDFVAAWLQHVRLELLRLHLPPILRQLEVEVPEPLNTLHPAPADPDAPPIEDAADTDPAIDVVLCAYHPGAALSPEQHAALQQYFIDRGDGAPLLPHAIIRVAQEAILRKQSGATCTLRGDVTYQGHHRRDGIVYKAVLDNGDGSSVDSEERDPEVAGVVRPWFARCEAFVEVTILAAENGGDDVFHHVVIITNYEPPDGRRYALLASASRIRRTGRAAAVFSAVDVQAILAPVRLFPHYATTKQKLQDDPHAALECVGASVNQPATAWRASRLWMPAPWAGPLLDGEAVKPAPQLNYEDFGLGHANL